ncbi:hypothetical protein GCM10010433_32580 [Streptomyces pulveraceus]|uniref:TnsA-like heteromeric transposase endonuclease subunit n=1 Tax=Streptomyces pulveraceus TaxID=68258 RepID=A0ABW1GVN5_9ACTN
MTANGSVGTPRHYFVRRGDGSALVVDVRVDERIEPKDDEAFEMTRLACTQTGWRFERLGTPDKVLLANARWLSRYRHPRCLNGLAAARLREVFATPGPLMAGADAAGDRLATLPVLFHLLWRQELTAEDMAAQLLGPRTGREPGECEGPVTGKKRVPPTARIAEFPEAAADQARWWEGHILEVLNGLPPGAPRGAKPRPEFDPRAHSLAQRERAKAAELTAAGHKEGVDQ